MESVALTPTTQERLTQIEKAGEQLLTQAIATIHEIENDEVSPTITIAAMAKRLGFDLAAFDGSLVAKDVFLGVGKEALFLTDYVDKPEESPRSSTSKKRRK